MMPETKLVKTASRSALAGRGERGRLLDDCKAPEAGRVVSHNRLGQASESPDPYRDARVAGQHDDSKRSSCTAAAARQAAGDLVSMS